MTAQSRVDEVKSVRNAQPRFLAPAVRWRLLLIGLLMISPILIRSWSLSTVPDIGNPFDVVEFCHEDILTGQNAFDHYREAHRLKALVDADYVARGAVIPPGDYFAVIANGWDSARDPVVIWLEDSREALNEWRRGTECQDGLYISPSEGDWTTMLPVIQSLREFTRIALCEAARLEAKGDFAEAAKMYVAILRSSRHASRKGVIIQRLIGCAIYAAGAEGLTRWSEDHQLTPTQIESVMKEVETADLMTPPDAEALKSEMITTFNSLQRPDWATVIRGPAVKNTRLEPVASAATSAILWMFGEPHLTRRLMQQVLANQIGEFDKPWIERQPVTGQGTVLLFQTDTSKPLNPNQLTASQIDDVLQRSLLITQMKDFFPSYRQFETALAREHARSLTLKLGLGLQAYRRIHGEFPEDPALVSIPGIDSWPVDPFDTSEQRIRYRRDTPSSAVVWSVGPDSNNDGGHVFSHKTAETCDIGYILRAR